MGILRLLLVGLLLLLPLRTAAGTPSPDDWRDQSIYQIMTDRFFDGDPSNNDVEGNYDPSDGYKIHGGDWAGIEEKLDYIQGLGMTAIWISPVQKNAYGAYHGYHIQDFYQMAPHFGGLGALRSLVDAAHARGMYVILDVIANHGGDLIDSSDPDYPDYHYPGDYVLRWKSSSNKAAAPFNDLSWYHNNGHINNWDDPEQVLGELFGLDDFKTEEPAVRDALIAAHKWLIDTTDADGFRIDTVKHVELDFWQEWGPEITAFTDSIGKNDFFQYGEIFDGSAWKNGQYTGTQAGGPFALESTLWYPMYFTAGWVFRDGGSTSALGDVYADSTDYDPTARNRLVIFLDNHDNSRFMGFGSGADNDEAKAKTAAAWMYSSLGVPCLYYGYEQEFDGGSDPWDREDMWDGDWDFGPSVGDNFDQTAPVYRFVRRLNDLRRQFPALRRGSMEEVASSGEAGLYAYYRRLAGEETVLVVLNTKGRADTLSIDPDLPGGTIYDLLSENGFTVPASGTVDLVVGGISAAMYAAAPPDLSPWVAATWPVHDGDLPVRGAPITITFSEAMNGGSVLSALYVSPSFSYAALWKGRTLVLMPDGDLSNNTTYTVEIEVGAKSASGDSLGAPFRFFFRVDEQSGPVDVPAGYYSAAVSLDAVEYPRSLELGREGGTGKGRLLIGDTGWDRVLAAGDRVFAEALMIDSLIERPEGLSLDREGGQFGGDLLIADLDKVLRARTGGAERGKVELLASLPASGSRWVVAIDSSGAYGGLAFVGATGLDSIYSLDSAGNLSPFAGTFADVKGLAFSDGGGFGRYLYATDGDGGIYQVDSLGAATAFTSSSLLNGACALAFDNIGEFSGALFVANESTQRILQVDSNGAVSIFSSGFASLERGDCLAFDRLGNLYALESEGAGSPRLVKILPLSLATDIPGGGEEPPPPAERFLLGPNVPNPFNPATTIRYEIPERAKTTLAVYDIRGKLVRTLISEVLSEGPGEITWNGVGASGRPAPSGLYFARLTSGTHTATTKMVLLR